ncbi:MAG: peptidase [Parcubacteria group bacterium]|nr:peptidase [Parcubacteria group bacterium]
MVPLRFYQSNMDIILALIVLILSIIVHEVAHGYAADSLGDPTARLAGRLTLNPIPHIDLMGSIVLPLILMLSHSPLFFGWAKPVPYNPYNLSNKRWGEAMVAVAGSATNLVLAVVFGLIVRFGAGLGLGAVPLTIAYDITLVNLFLGLFNLLPFPPLDGFTALRAALPWHLGAKLRQFEAFIRGAGPIALILFLFVFYSIFAHYFSDLVISLLRLLTGVGV